MSEFNIDEIRSELKQIIDFDVVDELWIVGSLAEGDSFGVDSDVDVICITELSKGEKDEFMRSDGRIAQELLYSPDEVWGSGN